MGFIMTFFSMYMIYFDTINSPPFPVFLLFTHPLIPSLLLGEGTLCLLLIICSRGLFKAQLYSK